jgi:PhnB protein
MAKAVPDGYSTVTAYLVVKNAADAIDFYKRAFGAKELDRMTGPGGQGVMHAEIQIGNSRLMLSDEFPGSGCQAPQSLGSTTCQMFLYVDDVDAAYQKAVSAGAQAAMPPADMFWGDRFGKLTDPFGHSWGMATHKEDVSKEEMQKRSEAFFAQMGSQTAGSA